MDLSPARRPQSRLGFDSEIAGTSELARGLAVISLHFGNANLVVSIPRALAGLLGGLVLQVRLPRRDRLFARPIRNGDSEAIRAARAFDAQKARLPGRQLLHARGHSPVTTITFGAVRCENHGVVRRLGCLGE